MDIKNLFTKRNIFILIGALVVIIIAIIVLVFILGGKPSKDLVTAVDTAWSSAKVEEQPTYLSKLDELSSYKLDSVEHKDDTYIISATVTAPDLGGQLAKLNAAELPQGNNAENINDFLCKQVEKAETKETKALIYAYKINGEYHITFSNEFADAMSGNLYEYSQKAYLEILQKYEEGELK